MTTSWYHGMPPVTDWSQYSACRAEPWGCGAEAGKACWDRRSQPSDAMRHLYERLTKAKPCKGRKRTTSRVRAQVEHLASGGVG